MERPTKAQINPFNCLDGQVAERNWHGLTVEEGAALIARNPIYYQEDFLWMGPEAFRYYAKSILLFLQSEAGQDDGLFVHCILGTMELRLNEIATMDRAAFLEIVDFMEANWSQYYSPDEEQMNVEDSQKLKHVREQLMDAQKQ